MGNVLLINVSLFQHLNSVADNFQRVTVSFHMAKLFRIGWRESVVSSIKYLLYVPEKQV